MRRRKLVIALFLLTFTFPLDAGNVNEKLIQAAAEGDTPTILALLETGANVNGHDHIGMTALMWRRQKVTLKP